MPSWRAAGLVLCLAAAPARGGVGDVVSKPPAQPTESEEEREAKSLEERCREEGEAASGSVVDCLSQPGVAEGGGGCEAAAVCKEDPRRMKGWLEMAGDYERFMDGLWPGRPDREQVADADTLSEARELLRHPEMTAARGKLLVRTLEDVAESGLRRGFPDLPREQARAMAAAWVRKGLGDQASAPGPRKQAPPPDLQSLVAGLPQGSRERLERYFAGTLVRPPADPVLVPGRHRAQADTGEEIGRAVLNYTPGVSDEMLKAFLKERPWQMPVRVITFSPKDAQELQRKMAEDWGLDKKTLLRAFAIPCSGPSCPSTGPLAPWPRDDKLLVNGDKPFLLLPKRPSGYIKDSEDALRGAYPGLKRRTSQVDFQGGHIMTGPEGLLVSDDVLRLNPRMTQEQIEKTLASETGRPVTLVPHVPGWPHIDLYLTPVGGRKVLVGDTRAGVRALQEWAGKDPERLRRVKEVLEKKGELRPLGAEQVLRVSLAHAPRLDTLSRRLKEAGYEVERMPLITGKIGRNPILTYNNVAQSGRHVYVGQYGLPPLDQAALEKYRGLGLDPKPIPALDLAVHGGAIHCAINSLSPVEVFYRQAELEAQALGGY